MKISGSFKTQDNNTIRVVFYNKKNTAASININTSDDIYFGEEPVIITTEIDDTFAHLLKTQAKITLVTRRWLGDYLFADNTKSIVVNIWKNDVCIFAGYVSANTYNQQYSHELEELEINCIDTLSTLKNRRLTDDTTYEDLVAQSTIRPFSWFFDKINLEDPAGVIPNLPEFPSEEMHAWFETGWGREVNDDSSINYYGIESECVILDEDTAVATGDTRRGEDKTPTYIQSTDTCIVDGVQYYKKYAWITVNGELVNTGDWIVGDPTGDMPYVVRQETRLTGWSTGVLPQPFDFWEHMTTFDVYSNGMEIAVSDSIGEQIPETPQTTTNGSYYEFRQGADDDLDYDEENEVYYYKNYAWVCVNNVCENSGQWQRGNIYSSVVNTFQTLVGWTYGNSDFEYYERLRTDYELGNGTIIHSDIYTQGSQIPQSPSTTNNGSYYYYARTTSADLYTDPDTGKMYYKLYAHVVCNNTNTKTSQWILGDEYLTTHQIYGYSRTRPVIVLNPNQYASQTQYTADAYDATTKFFAFDNLPNNFNRIIFWYTTGPNHESVSNDFIDITITNNLITTNCTSLKEAFRTAYMSSIDIIEFDTSNVTDMSLLFDTCFNLRDLDLSTWDTSSVTNMSNMFSGCENLQNLYISTWDTSSVTNMASMFAQCSNLYTLNLSSFNTSSVTNMNRMFSACSGLISLDLSNWEVGSNVTTTNMFYQTSSLTSITMNNVSNDTFNKIGSITDIQKESMTIYRDDDAYKWNSSTQQWEIQNNN